MLNKVSAVARALGIVLAIVSGFIPSLGFDLALVLVILGLIAGIGMARDRVMPIGVYVLVLPAVGAALAHLPMLGAQLGTIAGSLGLTAAGALASAFAMILFTTVKDDLTGITK